MWGDFLCLKGRKNNMRGRFRIGHPRPTLASRKSHLNQHCIADYLYGTANIVLEITKTEGVEFLAFHLQAIEYRGN